jgi:hypothetical protein
MSVHQQGRVAAVLLASLCVHLVSSAAIPSQCLATAGKRRSSDAIFFVLKFIATNYIAHAFTIKFRPGFGTIYTLALSLITLFFPYFGLDQAVRNIAQLSILEESPLVCAAKAGALCTLVRTSKWKPQLGNRAWCWL